MGNWFADSFLGAFTSGNFWLFRDLHDYVYNEKRMGVLSPLVRQRILESYHRGLGITEETVAFKPHIEDYIKAQEEAFEIVLAKYAKDYALTADEQTGLRDALKGMQSNIRKSAAIFDKQISPKPSDTPASINAGAHPDQLRAHARDERNHILEEANFGSLANKFNEILNKKPKVVVKKTRQVEVIPPPPPPPPPPPQSQQPAAPRPSVETPRPLTLAEELRMRQEERTRRAAGIIPEVGALGQKQTALEKAQAEKDRIQRDRHASDEEKAQAQQIVDTLQAEVNDLKSARDAQNIAGQAAVRDVRARYAASHQASAAAARADEEPAHRTDAVDAIAEEDEAAEQPEVAAGAAPVAPPPEPQFIEEEYEEEVERTPFDINQFKADVETAQKEAKEALEAGLNKSITTLHNASEAEQTLISILAVLTANKRRLKSQWFFYSGGEPEEYTVMLTGSDQEEIARLQKAMHAKSDMGLNANGGLVSVSGQSIIASKAGDNLQFSMLFPDAFLSRGYYTNSKHNTKADLLCLAELIKASKAKTIVANIRHDNPELAQHLAREAFEACREAGYEPDQISITVNGAPKTHAEISKEMVQTVGGDGQPKGREVGLDSSGKYVGLAQSARAGAKGQQAQDLRDAQDARGRYVEVPTVTKRYKDNLNENREKIGLAARADIDPTSVAELFQDDAPPMPPAADPTEPVKPTAAENDSGTTPPPSVPTN